MRQVGENASTVAATAAILHMLALRCGFYHSSYKPLEGLVCDYISAAQKAEVRVSSDVQTVGEFFYQDFGIHLASLVQLYPGVLSIFEGPGGRDSGIAFQVHDFNDIWENLKSKDGRRYGKAPSF